MKFNSLQTRKWDVEVVVFLMATEIDRLKGENDKLRFRLQEVYDRFLDRDNYELQIRDLRIRYEHLLTYNTQLKYYSI